MEAEGCWVWVAVFRAWTLAGLAALSRYVGRLLAA
jgi:hypothetical protein